MSDTTRDKEALDEIGNGESFDCVLDTCADNPFELDAWMRRMGAIERLLRRSIALEAAEARAERAEAELVRVREGVRGLRVVNCRSRGTIYDTRDYFEAEALRALLAGEDDQ